MSGNFFTPDDFEPKASSSKPSPLNIDAEGLKSLANVLGDALRDLLQEDVAYRAAAHTRPKRMADGTQDPYEFETVMVILKGEGYEPVAEEILTPEKMLAYVEQIADAITSAVYEAAFIRHGTKDLEVSLPDLIPQLAGMRRAYQERQNTDLIIRYEPAASEKSMPSIKLYWGEESLGWWKLPGAIGHLAQLQIAVQMSARNEEFGRASEVDLDLEDEDMRKHFLHHVNRHAMQIISENTEMLFGEVKMEDPDEDHD